MQLPLGAGVYRWYKCSHADMGVTPLNVSPPPVPRRADRCVSQKPEAVVRFPVRPGDPLPLCARIVTQFPHHSRAWRTNGERELTK